MTTKTPLFSRLSVVVVLLMAALAVYLFWRIHPPGILAPFQLAASGPAGDIAILGSAPSLLYTLALGLLIGSCAPTVTSARRHCLAWTGLALLLELSQYSGIAKPVSGFLYNISNQSVWELVGPYWTRGTFDPLDLLATLVGGTIALVLSGHSWWEHTDENIS